MYMCFSHRINEHIHNVHPKPVHASFSVVCSKELDSVFTALLCCSMQLDVRLPH